MSVLIAGMNMPNCCILCPLWNHEFGQCNFIPNSCYYNKDTGEELYDPFEEKNKDCPLSEVN